MKMKRFTALLITAALIMSLLTGCGGGGGKADASPNASAGEVNTVVDSKYISKDYMMTMLMNADMQVEETKDNLALSTPSGNAVIIFNLFPGIQNLSASANQFKAAIPASFENGKTDSMTDGYLFGYRAKIIPFTCTNEGKQINALSAVSIANQSLYTMTVAFAPEVTDSEYTLVQNVIDSVRILQPKTVDKATKKATYEDPYPDYVYYVNDTPDYYDLTTWVYLPYYYYSWWDGEYGYWSDAAFFQPDYDYYEDDSYYWNWGWDEEDDWVFYDEYADYYDYDYYDEFEGYYDDFEYDDAEAWDYYEEEADLSEDDATTEDDAAYEDEEVYEDQGVYEEEPSYEDEEVYEDQGVYEEEPSYEDESYYEEESYDDSGDYYEE